MRIIVSVLVRMPVGVAMSMLVSVGMRMRHASPLFSVLLVHLRPFSVILEVDGTDHPT